MGFLLEVLAFFLVLIFFPIRSSPSLETRVPRPVAVRGPRAVIGQFALTFSLNSSHSYGGTLDFRIPGARPSKTVHTFSHDLTTHTDTERTQRRT